MGKLVLMVKPVGRVPRSLAKTREKRASLVEVEKEMLGASHAEVGAYLLGLWDSRTRSSKPARFITTRLNVNSGVRHR
jgi:hypothetical protein